MIERPLYVEKIMAYTDTPFVKILTGVRRCGKSTILKMIMEKLQTQRDVPADRIVSYRFDSMRTLSNQSGIAAVRTQAAWDIRMCLAERRHCQRMLAELSERNAQFPEVAERRKGA